MADSGTVVELRVHGVSGTPPEALLGCPTEFIEQKAGDNSAGFYRRQEWIDDAVRGEQATWRRVMEAYSWGGLTSGPASRAVWLLFLPFIFINLAHWMLPPAATPRRSAAIAVGLLRLIALSFTLTLMLAAAVAVMDVTVWQCVALEHCAAQWTPLSALASLPRGMQVALSAVPLVVVIVVLWRLGQETTRMLGRPPSPAVMADEVPLESDTFWCVDPSVLRLRACHVMAWTAGLAALTLAAPLSSAPVEPTSRFSAPAVGLTLLAANGVILAVAVVATAWNRATARGGTGADGLTPPLLLLRWISVALLIISLVWVALADVGYPNPPTHLPGLRGAIYVLLGVQVVLLTMLFVCTGWSMRGQAKAADAAWRPTLRGYTGPLVALIAWLVGGAFSVGVGLWTAQVLGDAVVSTAAANAEIGMRATLLGNDAAAFADRVAALDAAAPLIVPPPYLWAAVAIVVVIVVTVIAVLVVWLWVIPKRARAELPAVLADYPGAPADTRAKQVAKSRALASLTDVGVTLVGGVALTSVAVIAVLTAWYLCARGGFESLPGYSPTITRASVFITLSLAIGLVIVAVQAFRDRQMRRAVAVLWDVITFWPRANHPLTPPCYAERTVPELLDRLRTLVSEPDTRVVIAAHSQGTAIAAATLLQYDDDTRERVALLTFGSPLRRLYARNFPAYFGTGALPRLAERQQSRWINLWALTDPIGSWVNDKADRSMAAALVGVDFRVLDVESLASRPDGIYPPICGHSGFWVRQEYEEAVTELEAEVTPAGAETDASGALPPTGKAL
jgi:hypothetical protein